MVKKRIITFCMCMFAVFSLVGCSKENKISKIEIIDNTIKTEYVVGEEVEINEFKLKLTYGNKEEVYNITKDMVTLSTIDNTIKGKQKVDINIDYDGMEIKLSVGVEFRLPDKVSSINALIAELPEPEAITFSNEEEIALIEENINSLNEFYKGYVENYQKFIDCKTELDELYDTYITPEFLNSRFVLKTNLDNFFYSLKQTDYSEENWKAIIKLYDNAISSLYLNENHDFIRDIVNIAVLQITKVVTLDQTQAIELRSIKITNIIAYRKNLLKDNYSDSKWALLDEIKDEYVDRLNVATSCSEVEELYTSAIEEFNAVDTLEDERIIALNILKEAKIEEVKGYRLGIDLTKYSNDNRNVIADYYNLCLENIRLADNENDIDSEISKFKNRVALVKTLVIEEQELLVQTRSEVTNELNAIYNEIDLFNYDSQNKALIQQIINTALNEIKDATNVNDISSIKNIAISDIDAIPTMEEQAIINLPIKIKAAKDEIDLYAQKLKSSDYSIENWNTILSIVETTKHKLDSEVTISTANKTIEDMINSAKTQIDNVNTIVEENEINLNRTKNSAITELDNYLKSLNEEDFADATIYELVKTRINNAKIKVFELTNEATINKLVQDTIAAVEDAKK